MGIHDQLLGAWADFNAQRITPLQLKAVSSGFGIYQQKNDAVMMRIRRTGGIVTLSDLRTIAGLLAKYGVPFAHITTRQAIQLHGVAPTEVAAALADCEAAGLHFRGGGGNTFRNVLVNPDSGLHADTAFDVLPYARALAEAFYTFDLAYALPRKIKIAFADRVADRMLCAIQDLGFVATTTNGERTFEVWLAGGIGNKPRVGFKLFDALPASECIRVAMAVTALFNDHGDRACRATARLRFLRAKLGDDGLAALFHEYYAKADAQGYPACPESALKPETYPVTTLPEGVEPLPGFEDWKAIACKPLHDGTYSVRLFVPFGNFTQPMLVRFCDFLEHYGLTRLQLLISQDLTIPRVHAKCLTALYRALVQSFPDFDLTLRSYVGHIPTCIGNTICKIGAADSPRIGEKLAKVLDAYLPANTPERRLLAQLVTTEVRISGCPNSCTAHPSAKFGFQCRKLGGQDVLIPFTPATTEPPTLGEAKPTPIAIDDLPAYLLSNLGLEL